MTNNQTESFNIFLIVISLTFAFIFPFELFLFSYAILGPLHYCTEISWLHDKNYFTKNKKSIFPLIILGIAFVISINCTLVPTTFVPVIILFCICLAFLFCFFLVYDFNAQYSIGSILFIILTTLVIYQVQILHLIFYYFLVTLIHVYVFTGLFILSGNMKRHNIIGHIGFSIFLLVPFICFLIPANNYLIEDYFKVNFSLIMNSMITDNFQFFHIPLSHDNFFQEELVIKFSRFISFAYTYHYLNWFSKTNIIGWHNISKLRLGIIMFVWLFSICIYAYNYMLGYQILLFLSLLHVFLEFPLNWQSFFSLIGIKKN